MIRKNHDLKVARAIMVFADSLMRAHHVDRIACTRHLVSLVNDQLVIEEFESKRSK